MSKLAAYGASLIFDPAGTPVTIAQVGNITGPGVSTEPIDVTTHDSASAHREFIAGLIDAGELSVEGFFDPKLSNDDGTSASGLLEAKATSRTVDTWQLEWTTQTESPYRRFSAMVTAFETGAPVDGAIPFSCTFKISGAITAGDDTP